MVYAAIRCLRANQIPPKDPLTQRQFQTFIKAYLELFKALKTKAIARVRVSAIDVEEVKDQFQGFHRQCKEHNIKPRDVLNFDEAGFQVSVAPRE